MGMFNLKSKGILGINGRNLDYIMRYNKRANYSEVDDKVKTKAMAIEAGIRVPELYAVIEYQEQIKRLGDILGTHRSFVIKPAQGSGGSGILVIRNKTPHNYIRASGKTIDLDSLKYHIGSILGGLYALGGIRDKAIIEARVENPSFFDDLAVQGVPDIRLIVFQGVPVMAMLRLPTFASDGRANLHSGGIGAGLCLRSGKTVQAILGGRFINRHSDTDKDLTSVKIPDWDVILQLAVKAGAMVKLGYIGVDIVLDKTHGPMLLELNARPGIAIQTANKVGLKTRLEMIERDVKNLTTSEDKIRYAQEHFGVF